MQRGLPPLRERPRVRTTDARLTWHGITLYGAHYVGSAVSHVTGKRL